jgi:hypothetical protein
MLIRQLTLSIIASLYLSTAFAHPNITMKNLHRVQNIQIIQ